MSLAESREIHQNFGHITTPVYSVEELTLSSVKKYQTTLYITSRDVTFCSPKVVYEIQVIIMCREWTEPSSGQRFDWNLHSWIKFLSL
ncbi:hypothetical protein DPMN_082206 [Dreissena polymorpha]|uniref:Uncharacterized protein n=1 Tax=Dreissena polymorpha TaxID=45954 RepID=A0A9D4BGM5_DREPO|nr:hypothetical protein DPMN_082206 [Dreissena polymorpha]